jgi:DNA-binding PadR family transcriptional regulator
VPENEAYNPGKWVLTFLLEFVIYIVRLYIDKRYIGENNMNRIDTKYSPLTETTLFILLSLLPRSRHGYAIMKDVLELSQGRINLTAGTLYGALKRLLEQKWIERIDDDGEETAEHPGLPRKAYRLTDNGRDILNAEMIRLNSVIEAARRQWGESLLWLE